MSKNDVDKLIENMKNIGQNMAYLLKKINN